MYSTSLSNSNADLLAACAKRLRYVRKLTGLTRPEIERRHNIKETTLAKWESGKVMLSLKGAQKLLIVFQQHSINCSLEWLLYGAGHEPFVINSDAADGSSMPLVIEKPDYEILLIEEIRHFKKLYQQAVVSLISDDAMLPQFCPGDFVGGIQHFNDEINGCIDKNCIIETADGKKKVRRVSSGDQKGLYNLASLNPRTNISVPTQFNIQLKYAAPIIWHRMIN